MNYLLTGIVGNMLFLQITTTTTKNYNLYSGGVIIFRQGEG